MVIQFIAVGFIRASLFIEELGMKKEANTVWDVVGAALLALAIPIFIAVGLGMAALFGAI